MNEVESFPSEVIPQLRQEVAPLHGGDAAPCKAQWSHLGPTTLFGAELSGRGWSEIEPAFNRFAASLPGSLSCDYDVLGAGVSGDLGYIAEIERTEAASYGGKPQPMHCASRPFFAERMARGGRSTDTAIRLMTPPEMPSLHVRTSGPCRSRSDAAHGPHQGHRLRFLREQQPPTGLCPRSHD